MDDDTGSGFVRLAAWSQRHHWLAVLVWGLVLAAVTVAAQVAGAQYRNDFSLPGTESQRLQDAMRVHAPGQAGESARIVVHADGGLATPAVAQRVSAMLAKVATLPHVAAVAGPFQGPGAVSPDGRTGFAGLTFDAQATDLPPDAVRQVIDTARSAAGDGLQVELGGEVISSVEPGGGGPAEGAGILAALVILVFMFGSLLAAAMPLVTAVFAVGSTIGLIALASHVVDVPSYTTPLMVLVGLGVGIDYALLVFARHRGELLAGADRTAAVRTALDTAGRSVLFAGVTVIIALLGLLALGLGSLRGVALAVAATVLVTMLASLTLLPALLTILGGRIERSVRRRAERSRGEPGRRWRRWADGVARRPVLVLVLGVTALLVLALPAAGMRLGIADAGTRPPEQTTRKAYDLLAAGFGPGVNGPLIVLAEAGPPAGAPLAEALATTAGVARVVPPQPLPDGRATLAIVVPAGAPQDGATAELVTRLRGEVLAELSRRTGVSYLVGGSPAAAGDFAAAVAARLPLFVLVVVGLSALLLMAVFRSLLIPLKAAVLNVLSIAACLGVITLVFQDGWFGAQPGPVEAFLPVLIFAIVFGLSMDYEVFLLSRMHEFWRRTGDPAVAVREGLATTGGVITAAAAIMVVVFGAFLLSPDRMLRQFGLGLAVAVLLDALVIRCLVVPAVMRLFGARAWWLPTRLDRVLPPLALEPAAAAGRS